MNPQRLVAAVAALAIGFGVTLAGVIATDDPVDTISSDAAADADVDGNDGVDQGAEQDEAPAAEPDPADAEPAQTDEATDDVGAEAEQPVAEVPSQEAPSQPSEQPSQDTRVPISDSDEIGEDCDVAYVVIGVEGDLAVLTDDDVFIASDGRIFLPEADVSLDELDNIEQIQVRVAAQVREDDDVFVDCDDETVIAERNAVEFLDEIERLIERSASDSSDSGEISSGDGGEAGSLDFPCGEPVLRAIERTYIEQFDLAVETDTDYEVVLVSLAQRVTAVSVEFGRPENDLQFWVDELQGPFGGFRIDGGGSQACALLAENLAPATSTREVFFCSVGQLASNGELLDFFDGLVPLAADCAYPNPTSGGIGGIRDENDQGEN